MNGKCVYSGVALEHQVTMLKPDTDYKFEVIYILKIIKLTLIANIYDFMK